MTIAKISHSEQMPSFAMDEARERRRYPTTVKLSTNVTLVFRKTRYRLVADSWFVRKSESFGS